MTMLDENDQVDFEYIQLQYQLADALQEIREAPPPYHRIAQARYGQIRKASQALNQRLSRLRDASNYDASPMRQSTG